VGRERQKMERLGCQITHLNWKYIKKKKKKKKNNNNNNNNKYRSGHNKDVKCSYTIQVGHKVD
jgi:hypothetical protein